LRFFSGFYLAAALAMLSISALGQSDTVRDSVQVHGPIQIEAVRDPATDRMSFSYAGQNTAPTIRVSPGESIQIDYLNKLPEHSDEKCAVSPCMDMTNLHFHGLHVSPNAPQDDVLTMMAMPGQSLHYTVPIPAYAPPGLYWYHTHPHGESYRQALDGMSGAIVIEGIDRYVPEVRKMRERILALRSQEVNPHDPNRATILEKVSAVDSCGKSKEEIERVLTINGQLRPEIPIAPGERQFWRIANESPDLYADLQIDGEQVEIVALDGMPLAYHNPNQRTRKADHVLISPGGRVEAIVTGPPAGTHTSLRSHCIDTGADGDPNPEMVLADLTPTHSPVQDAHTVPADRHKSVTKPVSETKLAHLKQEEPQFTVIFTEDKNGFYINGKKFSMSDDPMLTVQTGSYQHWRVINRTKELHPFHIHQVHFLPYAVNGKTVTAPEWLDTVNVSYGESVDLIMDFTDPIIRGMSVFHCHLLQHEDKGMMAKILFK
jgi:suppressor of ftsI